MEARRNEAMKRILGIITMIGTLGAAAPAMAQEWYGGGGGYGDRYRDDSSRERRALMREQRALRMERYRMACLERARLEQRRDQLIAHGYGPGSRPFRRLQREIVRHDLRYPDVRCRPFHHRQVRQPVWGFQVGFNF
jgi:hypothetical protein